MKRILIAILWMYQRSVSPDHSWAARFFPYGFCRFYPTCSEYAIAAFNKYGIVRGGIKILHRLGSCHPWNKGGIDPV